MIQNPVGNAPRPLIRRLPRAGHPEPSPRRAPAPASGQLSLRHPAGPGDGERDRNCSPAANPSLFPFSLVTVSLRSASTSRPGWCLRVAGRLYEHPAVRRPVGAVKSHRGSPPSPETADL